MPFKSESQRRLFWAKVNRGEISRSVAEEWESATGDKKLPEKVKESFFSFSDELQKLAGLGEWVSNNPRLATAAAAGILSGGLFAASLPGVRSNAQYLFKKMIGQDEDHVVGPRKDVDAQAKLLASALRASGVDPSSAKIAVSGTPGTGKTTLVGALAKELGMKHEHLAINVKDAFKENIYRNSFSSPGTIYEQTFLLNHVDPDKFDAIVRVHKPADVVRKQILERGKNAIQVDMWTPDLGKDIEKAFHATAGKPIRVHENLEFKVRPENGFQAEKHLDEELSRKGISPEGMSRNNKIVSIIEGSSSMAPGLISHLDIGGHISKTAFVDELQKIAYGPSDHVELANIAASNVAPEMSPGVHKAIVDGAEEADYGIRFPFFPWTDEIHSFPNQSREKVLKNIEKIRQKGIDDLAAAIANEEHGDLRNAQAYRGLKNIGEGSHAVADLGSHFEKPREMGVEMPVLREALKRTTEGYGGVIPSFAEHLATGYELDDLDPKKSPTDRRTIQREIDYGRSIVRDLHSKLQGSYGFTKDKAQSRTKEFLSKFNPSTSSKVIGEGTRTGTYAVEQASRAGRAMLRLRDKILGYATSEDTADGAKD